MLFAYMFRQDCKYSVHFVALSFFWRKVCFNSHEFVVCLSTFGKLKQVWLDNLQDLQNRTENSCIAKTTKLPLPETCTCRNFVSIILLQKTALLFIALYFRAV